MIKNLIKTAFRHIIKHLGYSILNILGLTLGISSALFLIIYVSDEASYDRYHEKADRIYRVSSKITEPDDQFTWNVAQIPFGPQVVQDYPEVQSFVRFIPMNRSLFKYEDKEFNEEDFFYVDSTLFDIFTYELVKGEVRSALLEPKKIILTETLEGMTSDVDVEALLSQQFEYTKNVNYRLIEGAEQMSSLMLKTQKAAVLPTLAGFYNYGTNGMGDKVSDLQWFQNSMAGLQLSVPIFASGQRYTKIRKAQISLDKARNTKDMVTEQLLLQEKQLRYNLVNANLQYKSQKANVEVSKRVYASTENKFKQGMASSLELTQANSLYLQAENNYVSALMNLLQTKLALDKLLNNM